MSTYLQISTPLQKVLNFSSHCDGNSQTTSERQPPEKNGRANSLGWTPGRVSPPGFHAAIFSSRFTYGRARQTKQERLVEVYNT